VIGMAQLVEKGVLPEPGGWQDQPATFTQAYPHIMREVAHWTQMHRDIAMEQARKRRK
jgi:hypothetical protein